MTDAADPAVLVKALEDIETKRCGDNRKNCHHMGEILRGIATRALAGYRSPSTPRVPDQALTVRTAGLIREAHARGCHCMPVRDDYGLLMFTSRDDRCERFVDELTAMLEADRQGRRGTP
jgi:hypothetical protein